MRRTLRRCLLPLLLLLLVACGGGEQEDDQQILPSTPLSRSTTEISPSPTTAATPTPTPLSSEQQPAEVEGGVENAPAASEDQVPAARLENSEGESQIATTGSYCWSFPEAEGGARTICADTFALLAPETPLVVSPLEPLTFVLDAGAPQFVTMRVLEWIPAPDIPPTEGNVAVNYEAPVLAEGDLEPVATPSWEAPPEPGEYLLDMHAVFSGGSISYGWHIVVE